MPDLKKVLEEYVATANNPKYNSDFNVINSKFPELKNYDKKLLEEYVATANNEEYNSDFNIINSKFPEFFGKPVEKKNPNAPTASSGMGVSMAGKGSDRSVLGNYGISTKPKQKEATTGVPISIASPELLKQSGFKPKEQFSNLGNLNKEVVEKVKTVTQNQQKEIQKMAGGPKGMLEVANDAIVSTLTSGTASLVSGAAGLIGGLADLTIDKTPEQSKKAPFLSTEWFKSKAPFVQEGEVADPAWYSNQGVRDKLFEWSSKLSEIAQGESEAAKTELGVVNTKDSSVDAILKGNYKDAALSLLVDIGTQIPQLAAMYASGGSSYALGAMGATSAGSDMTRQYEEDGDISSMDFAQSAAIGITEAVSEKIFGTDIAAAKLVGQKLSGLLGASGRALQQQIRSEGVDAVKGKLIRSFGEVLKATGKGAREEVFEENLVSAVSFLVDSIDEDKFNKEGYEQLLKDMAQNILVAGPLGGGMSFMAAKASFEPLTKEEKIKIQRYQEVIDSETASNDVKKIAQAKLDAINNGASIKAEENYDKVMELPLEERVLVMDKMNKIKSLEAEYETLSDMDMKDSVIERISQLDEEINFALNPKEAEVQGTARGIEAATDTTTKMIEQSDKIQEIEGRMNNAEYIDEKDINSATDELYALLDEVDKTDAAPEVKQGMVAAIENKIQKLESYEFETTSQVTEPGQTKAVSRGIQIIGTTTRGSKSKNAVTAERLNKKSVTAVDGTTGETMDGEFVLVDGKLDVVDRKAGTSKVFDTGRLEYTETNLDEDGVVQSVTLSDPTTGDVFTINDPDIALDLAIQEKTKQLGEITDGVLEEVIQEVEVAPVVKTTLKDKQIIKNPAPSVLPNIPASSPTTTTQTTSTPSTKSPKPTTPEEAAKLSKQMIDEEKLAVFSFKQKMAKAKSLFSVKKWIDRQATIRKELNRAGAKVTEAFMTNVAGARAFADKRFEDVEKKIYDKLSLDDEKILDQLAFHNRVIQIDENFENRRLDAEIKIEELQKELDAEKARLKSMAKKPTLQEYKKSERLAREIKQQKDNLKDTPLHPKGFDKATSELAIQGLRNEIGDEKFDNLNKRLGDIFSQFNKILEEQYEAGLLNQETYDRFKEDKYIPRRFLTYLLVEPGTKNISPIAEKSLTKEQIKSIEGGSESLLFTDTRVLLNAAMRSSAFRIAQNYANKALAKTIESLGDNNPIGKKANYSFSKGGIKTDAFGNKVTKEPEAGYTNIFYFNEKGERDAIQVKNELAKEWLDAEKQFDDFSPLLKTVLMNGVLKSFATGMNPTFFISNVPVDFVNTILFTNVYDDTNIFNASRKLAAAFTKNAYNYSKLESGANVDPKFKENYTEWVENGGMMQFLTDQGRPDEIAQRDAEIRNKKSLMPLNKLKKGVVNTLAFSGEVSEKAMRLAIFEKTKANLIEEAGGRSKISDTEYKEILAMAAASSRKTMDFAQGGLFAKKADVFLPYLNAAIQGLRVSVEYVKSNPKKFVGKLAQASVPIAALMVYNMSIMDDPEEWADIPPHEKLNYFIILKPWKNDDGKREYYRVKKHPSIQWFANAVERSVIGIRDLSVEQKDKINKGSDFVSSEWETINNALPIPLDWKKSLAKSPAVLQAAIAYVANFDLFRNEKISQDFGEVTPVLEGKYDKNVPLFYKEFGKATGSSPKRTQAAVEKVVTNPGTNAIVGLSYSLLDNMVTGLTGKPKTGTESKYQDASPKGIGDIFKARVVREINPKYSEFKDTRAKDLELELKSQDKEIKSDIKAIIKAKTDNKEAVKDAVDYIKKLDVSVEEKPRLLKFIEDQVKLKQAIGSTPDADLYIDLKYERDPRLKAFVFFDRFGIVDTETKKEVIQNAKKFGYKLFGNDRFDAEYMRLVNEQMALSKSKQK